MPVPPFRLQAITRIERHAATRMVRRAILTAGGSISDFRQISNLAIVLELQIPPARLAALYGALMAEGISLSPTLSESPVHAAGDEDLAGTLRVEFIHDEPELRIAIPAVPG